MVDSAKIGKPKGMNNPKVRKAVERGKKAHKEFKEKVDNKPYWESNPFLKHKGEIRIPDALTPTGRPVELKPKTPTGIKKGAAQLKRYEEAYNKKGRVVYYDPADY